MMSSSQSIPFFQQYQYKYQPPVEEDSPTIHKSKMLLKELSHDNRLDDDASSNNNNIPTSFLPSVSQPTKRKRDDIDEITFSRRHDYNDDDSTCSGGTSDEEDDDDGYILFPLHKRYASSSSAFNVSSYDFERREGPADSSSSTHAHDSPSFVDDTTSDTTISNNVLDEETAALVSNFRRESIFRQTTSTTMAAVPVVQQPMPITPLADTSFTCSLYADDDNHEGHYPDFPSIGRATTIDEDSSSRSSIFSNDPPDMMGNNSSRPTSPSRYEEEEEIMIEHHEDYCYEVENDDESSPSSWSSIEEKDADEEARERPHPAWLVSSASSSSRTRLEPSQPSPLWMPNRGC